MPHLILENKNLILFLNLKFNFMKRRGLIFNSRPNKTAVFALGLMLGLCPVSKAWADTNMKDSQVVEQKELLRILTEIIRLVYLLELS